MSHAKPLLACKLIYLFYFITFYYSSSFNQLFLYPLKICALLVIVHQIYPSYCATNPKALIANEITSLLTKDYISGLLNLMQKVQTFQHNIRKRTYSYGLDVVGRPIDQLSVPEMIISAILMPRKFYHQASDNVLNRISVIGKLFNRKDQPISGYRILSAILDQSKR